ncbi:MAG: type II secretion system protein [Vicinamibacterales bacterium]|nr:type II secretion system protein [Vicinamibacterales bacterium]
MGRERGTTLVEMVVVAGLVALLSVVSVPILGQAAADARAHGAARYVATKVHAARLEAARRGAHVALQFQVVDGGVRFTAFVDGNGNGVRSADIASGVDRPLGPSDALGDHFGDVDFAVVFSTPGIDGGAAVALGDDPIRLGAANMLSWSPVGSATSGTLYVAGPRGPQFAVRIFGATGRTRVLRFDPGAGAWRPH